MSDHATQATRQTHAVSILRVCMALTATGVLTTILLFGAGLIHFLPGHILLTRSSSPLVRMGGCDALGGYHNEDEVQQAVQALEACLSDTDTWVRLAAIEALVKLQHRESEPRLLLLINDEDVKVSTTAREALAKWQSPELYKHMLRAVHSPKPNKDELLDAGVLLGYYDRPETLPALERVIAYKDDLVARNGIVGLARLDTPAAWQVIMEASRRNDFVGDLARSELRDRRHRVSSGKQ